MQIIPDLGNRLDGESFGNRIVVREAGVRFNLSMVDFRTADLCFADKIRRRKTLLLIAKFVMDFAFEIARLIVV